MTLRRTLNTSLSVLALAFAAGAIAVAVHAPAAAQAVQIQNYSIPAQPLNAALLQLAEQSGLEIVFDARLTQGRNAPALNGDFTPQAALDRLLAGSGLTYRFADAGTVTLSPMSQQTADGPIEAGPLLIGGEGVVRGSDVDPLLTYETPASVSVITGENIERFRGVSPADFLRGTPGVLSGESRGGGAIDVNIRGLQSFDRTIVRVDGARQSSTSTRGYMGETTRTFIDPDLIGGVIVNKGPSSDLQSAGAIGGLLEVRTLDPDDIIKEGKDWGVRLRGGVITNTTDAPPPLTEGGFDGGGLFTTFIDPTLADIQELLFGVRPEVDVVEFPQGGPERLDRPGVLEPTDGHFSLAGARRFGDLSVIGAYSRRQIGNYFAGEEGDDGPRSILVSENEECIPSILFSGPPFFFPLPPGTPDELCSRSEFYRAEGVSEYRPGEEILNTSSDSHSGLFKLQYEFGPDHDLEFGYQRYESEFGFQFPSNLNGSSLNREGIPSKVEVDTFTSRYRFNPADNNLIDLEVNAWFTSQFFDEAEFQAFSTEDFPNTLIKRDTERSGLEIENTSRFGDVALTVGAARGRTTGTFDQTFQTISFLGNDPDTGEAIFGFEVLDNSVGDLAARDEWALTANLDWYATDWLTLSAGVQRVGYEQAPTGFPFDDGYRVEGEDDSDDGDWKPSLRAVVEPLDGLQLFASYAEALRLPSETENLRARLGVESVPDPAALGIRPLGPEDSRNIEFGVNYVKEDLFGPGDVFGAKLVYFNNQIDGYIARLQADEPTLPFFAIVVVNLDQATFEGAEFSAYFDNDRYFAEFAATQYFDVEFCRPEDFAVYTVPNFPEDPVCRSSGSGQRDYAKNHVPPEFSATLTAGARFFDRRLALGSRVRHTEERFGEQVTGTEAIPGVPRIEGGLRTITWEANTLVDLFGSYKFNDTVSLDVTVDNLLDFYYLDPLNLSTVPGPGRTIRANLTVHF